MKIDSDRLNEPELIDLNRRIVQCPRFLQQMRAHARMLEFSIGDRVTFQPLGRPAVAGIVTRYNRKGVTVISAGGEQRNVAPQLRQPAPAAQPAEPGGPIRNRQAP